MEKSGKTGCWASKIFGFLLSLLGKLFFFLRHSSFFFHLKRCVLASLSSKKMSCNSKYFKGKFGKEINWFLDKCGFGKIFGKMKNTKIFSLIFNFKNKKFSIGKSEGKLLLFCGNNRDDISFKKFFIKSKNETKLNNTKEEKRRTKNILHVARNKKLCYY